DALNARADTADNFQTDPLRLFQRLRVYDRNAIVVAVRDENGLRRRDDGVGMTSTVALNLVFNLAYFWPGLHDTLQDRKAFRIAHVIHEHGRRFRCIRAAEPR